MLSFAMANTLANQPRLPFEPQPLEPDEGVVDAAPGVWNLGLAPGRLPRFGTKYA